ncbi:AraC family transcriptional regulator [Luteolibacter algae]|uniref:AraC family transcriptional regulator n=1 Tax=Luteolibacter algae TaxID=454151 RepID=A0ABW5D7T4_9BACT
MRLTRENTPTSDGSPLLCLEIYQPHFDSHYHHHPEIEITWILNGDGQRLIGDSLENFTGGDLVLIGSDLPHQYRSAGGGQAIGKVLKFDASFLENDFSRIPECKSVRGLLERSGRGLIFSDPTRQAAQRKIDAIFRTESRLGKILGLIELLHLLGGDETAQTLAGLTYESNVKPKQIARLERVLNYIDSHWREPITLADVAEIAALHPQSLSRFFQQHLGMDFRSHLIKLRLSHAAQMLLETEQTVTEIAFSCGFNNIANFNRHFRSIYQRTPSTYRKG